MRTGCPVVGLLSFGVTTISYRHTTSPSHHLNEDRVDDHNDEDYDNDDEEWQQLDEGWRGRAARVPTDAAFDSQLGEQVVELSAFSGQVV